MDCDRCGARALIRLRYSGMHLCREHLDADIVRRVKGELRECPHIPRRGGRVAIAVSGGKDSLAMAHLLSRIIGEWRGVELVGITVDEGIAGYRPESIGIAREALEELGISHRVVRFRDDPGMELDSMVNHPGAGDYRPCTLCGVFRRALLNRAAREEGCSVMAMGHNLDDCAQSVLMNVLRGDVDRILKLAPHRRAMDGLVPRMLPLRRVPQKEVYLYALIHDIPVHEGECPYAVEAHRRGAQDMLYTAEGATPGSMHSLLRLQDGFVELASLDRDVKMPRCGACGEPCSGHRCKACEIAGKLGLGTARGE